MSVVRPFSVHSKDEIGPESKTGRFLSKAEILGVLGVFSPLSSSAQSWVHQAIRRFHRKGAFGDRGAGGGGSATLVEGEKIQEFFDKFKA